MNMTLTPNNHLSRVERVQSYIANHLDEDLDFDQLADIAAMSPYHWHRIYRSICGETATQTVRRMRMHRAAVELIRTSTDVNGIAKRAGYGSVEAFSRAFGSAYGEPPASYRRRATPPAETGLNWEPDTETYPVRIENKPQYRLLAARHQGDYMLVGQAFEKVVAYAFGNGLLFGAPQMVGIYHKDPGTHELTDLYTDAGVILENGPEVPAETGLTYVMTPGGRQAILTFKGPYAELEQAYCWLFGQWLPESGEEAADDPVSEYYLNDPKSVPASELLTEIRLTLKG